MTYKDFQQELVSALSVTYSAEEASSVSSWIMLHLAECEATAYHLKRNEAMPDVVVAKGIAFRNELLKGRPVQYVLNESWFDGLHLYVDENVLIPRPETEELIGWIRHDYASLPSPETIVDLCTGSGCMALALKKSFPAAHVTGLDISEGALKVAGKNSHQTGIAVDFKKDDLLRAGFTLDPFPELLVSNPPYVRQSESSVMHSRVLDHEPHLALFVRDDDALIFYRIIFTLFAKATLPKRRLYVEINESLSEALLDTGKKFGLHVDLKNDMFGKPRFIRCLPENR